MAQVAETQDGSDGRGHRGALTTLPIVAIPCGIAAVRIAIPARQAGYESGKTTAALVLGIFATTVSTLLLFAAVVVALTNGGLRCPARRERRLRGHRALGN